MKRKIIPYNPKFKGLAKALRNNMTFAEVLLWNELKQKKMYGYDFDRQRPIDEFILDFYCKDLMLAIEVDGIAHITPEEIADDEIKQGRLNDLGVTVLRIEDVAVRKDIKNVVYEIEGWIENWEERNPELSLPGRIYKNDPPLNPLQGGDLNTSIDHSTPRNV